MALKDLKSDLSKFRKPLDTTPIVDRQTSRANKDWKTTPLAERAVPGTSQIPKTPQKTGINATTTTPTGRHTKGTDVTNSPSPTGRHTEGKEVTNNVPLSGNVTSNVEVTETNVSGRHTEGKEVVNTVPLSGRVGEGVDVDNTSPLSGRHTEAKEVVNTVPLSGRLGDGVDVTNNSDIEGRHTEGKEVVNGSDISGRHTNGVDNPNTSVISGRHETDNSGFNIDGQVPTTTPDGRHTNGVDNPNTSPLDGRHTDGVDTVNQSPLDGRHTNGVDNPNTSPLSGRHTDGTEVFNNSALDGRHETGTSIDNNKYSTKTKRLHEAPHNKKHSQLDINNLPLSNATQNQNGFVEGVGGLRTNDKSKASRFVQFAGSKTTIQNYTDLDTVGNSKLGAQLGEGTFVPGAGAIVGHPVKMIASDLGYSTDRNYSEIVGVSKLSALGHQYIQKNSPSFLDAAYSKFKVRDEAYNPTWMKHPLILRGIQKDGEAGYDPERFGFGGPDGGLIRGGAVTATVRTALDVVRIGKFMASPAGLLWNIKQVGLGLTNPNVESIGPKLTKIHTGVTSLLSVAGSAFGAHITTHGIPFANEIASYENVLTTKLNAEKRFGNGSASALSRLVGLHNTSFGFAGLPGLTKGLPFPSLTGLGGPQSVYGIGVTSIKRSVDTRTDAQKQAKKYNTISSTEYGQSQQYASTISNNKFKSNNTSLVTNKDILNRNIETVNENGLGGEFEKSQGDVPISGDYFDKYPLQEKPLNPDQNPTAAAQNTKYPDMGIKSYSSLAYSKLPTRQPGNAEVLDFRKDQSTDVAFGTQLTDQAEVANYTENNITKKFGFGSQGQVGKNVGDYTQPAEIFRGDKVNKIDAKIKGSDFGTSKFSEIYQLIQGEEETKDFIPFYFTGPSQIGTGTDQDTGTEEVLVFRNTVGQVTDTFSPSWNSTQILGRADAVHTYNTWGRGVSFDFKVHATSREEMKPMWRKLNYLSSWTAPNYSSGVMRGGYIRFTLGNMFQETPCFISGLTISTDTDTPWEINLENDEEMLQLPHGVNVSMQLTMLMDYRPQWNGRMYSLSDRGRLDNKSTKTNWLTDSTSETAQTEDDKDVEQAK
jgi:hypothetical protein